MYLLTTPYGNRYKLDADGTVTRLDLGERYPKWVVLGLVKILPFNNVGPIIPLDEAVQITDWTFKNGRPRYTVVDLDHGTRRLWGNWNYHGVQSLRLAQD